MIAEESPTERTPLLYGLLVLVHLVFWVIALVEILKSNMHVMNKLLWILIVFLLPVVGLILYYSIGRN